KRKKHHVEIVVDRLSIKKGSLGRLTESVETALRHGGGTSIAAFEAGEDRIFSEKMACKRCGISFPELTPAGFSFNSPQGMCAACNGLGTRVEIDPELVVPDDRLSIDEGAIAPWGPDVSKKVNWAHGFRGQILSLLGIDMKKPWRELTKRERQLVL